MVALRCHFGLASRQSRLVSKTTFFGRTSSTTQGLFAQDCGPVPMVFLNAAVSRSEVTTNRNLAPLFAIRSLSTTHILCRAPHHLGKMTILVFIPLVIPLKALVFNPIVQHIARVDHHRLLRQPDTADHVNIFTSGGVVYGASLSGQLLGMVECS